MPSENPSRIRLIVAACAVLVCVTVVLWLQAALAGLPEHGLRAAPNSQLTQAYTSALAAGQSHLQQAPDPRLLALPNPYDPAKNGGLGLLDVSLYQQRYYLYFGIVPWALLLVPWFKLTGTHLSDAAAIWIFCSAGFTCYAVALFQIWRRWFGQVSPLILAPAILLLSACSGFWVLLDLPQMTQIPSAAAYGFLGFAWLALVCAAAYPSFGLRWLGVAMAGAALTMGCRPNYAPCVAVLAGWTGLQVWRHTSTQHTRSLLTVFAPLIIIGALLAGWNLLRFGNPLEFGFSYQLVATNRAAGESEMSTRYLAFNLHRYLVGGARWTDYFPFIAGEAAGPFALPAGHEESDQVYGFMWVAPVVIVGLAAIAWNRLVTLRPLSVLAAVGGMANLLQLGAYGGSAYRYPVDFMPMLALVACIGLLSVATWTTIWPRRLALASTGVLLVWSTALSLCQTAALYDHFKTVHSQAFHSLARPFNAFVYLREHQTSDGPRSLRLHLQFPPDRTGQVEPLVVLGPQSQQDFLYVYYSAPGQLRFGFESIGRGGPTSRPVSVDLAQPHTLDLHYGSFLPPDDHPLLRATPAADRDLSRRILTVTLDGRPVLDGWADFHPPRGVEHIGTSPDDNAFGPRFTGTITRIERPLLTAPQSSTVRTDPAHYGPIQLNVILRPAPAGTREPLLTLGHRNQGELFVVERVSSTHVRIGLFPTAGPETWSVPFAWPLNRPQTLTLATGALLPPATASLWPAAISADARALAKRTVELRLEDQLVWRTEVPPLDVSPSTVVPGRNDLLLSGIAPTLAADIITTTRLPWAGLTKPVAPPDPAAGSAPKISGRTSIPR